MVQGRPRVSPDTRLLLVIIVAAVAALWVLARVRFPDRVPTPNPVPPVLAQLTPPSALEDIASTVLQVGTSLQPSLAAVEIGWPDSNGASVDGVIAAFRFRRDRAVALMQAGVETVGGGTGFTRDPVTGLAVVHTPEQDSYAVETWSPRQPYSPRYLLTSDLRQTQIAFRPVFVGWLEPIESPLWEGQVWSVPEGTELESGAFVFNLDGALAGLVIARSDGMAIVPADTVIAVAERLSLETPEAPGVLGIQVDALTAQIAAVTKAHAGVIVTWIDPAGPAASTLRVTDVVEAIGGQALVGVEHWEARMAKVRPGEWIALTVRRPDGVHQVGVTAAQMLAVPQKESLGLTLRTIRGTGSAVAGVAPHSAASRAGIVPGDIITAVDGLKAPAERDITRAYGAAPSGGGVLLGITRGETHRVVAVQRIR